MDEANQLESDETRDAALLLHGMMCVAGADGTFADAEIRIVEAYCSLLPELRQHAFDDLMARAQAVVSRYGSIEESLSALDQLSSPALRNKLFVVAADVALSSGKLGPREDKMLQALQRTLGVDDALRNKILDVLALKHA